MKKIILTIVLFLLIFPLSLFSEGKTITIETKPEDCQVKVYEKTFTTEGKGELFIEGKAPLEIPPDIIEKAGRKGIVVVVSKDGYESTEIYFQPPYKSTILLRLQEVRKEFSGKAGYEDTKSDNIGKNKLDNILIYLDEQASDVSILTTLFSEIKDEIEKTSSFSRNSSAIAASIYKTLIRTKISKKEESTQIYITFFKIFNETIKELGKNKVGEREKIQLPMPETINFYIERKKQLGIIRQISGPIADYSNSTLPNFFSSTSPKFPYAYEYDVEFLTQAGLVRQARMIIVCSPTPKLNRVNIGLFEVGSDFNQIRNCIEEFDIKTDREISDPAYKKKYEEYKKSIDLSNKESAEEEIAKVTKWAVSQITKETMRLLLYTEEQKSEIINIIKDKNIPAELKILPIYVIITDNLDFPGIAEEELKEILPDSNFEIYEALGINRTEYESSPVQRGETITEAMTRATASLFAGIRGVTKISYKGPSGEEIYQDLVKKLEEKIKKREEEIKKTQEEAEKLIEISEKAKEQKIKEENKKTEILALADKLLKENEEIIKKIPFPPEKVQILLTIPPNYGPLEKYDEFGKYIKEFETNLKEYIVKKYQLNPKSLKKGQKVLWGNSSPVTVACLSAHDLPERELKEIIQEVPDFQYLSLFFTETEKNTNEMSKFYSLLPKFDSYIPTWEIFDISEDGLFYRTAHSPDKLNKYPFRYNYIFFSPDEILQLKKALQIKVISDLLKLKETLSNYEKLEEIKKNNRENVQKILSSIDSGVKEFSFNDDLIGKKLKICFDVIMRSQCPTDDYCIVFSTAAYKSKKIQIGGILKDSITTGRIMSISEDCIDVEIDKKIAHSFLHKVKTSSKFMEFLNTDLNRKIDITDSTLGLYPNQIKNIEESEFLEIDAYKEYPSRPWFRVVTKIEVIE